MFVSSSSLVRWKLEACPSWKGYFHHWKPPKHVTSLCIIIFQLTMRHKRDFTYRSFNKLPL